MPLIDPDYRPPYIFRSGHISTIYSGLLRQVPHVYHKRERLELADGDFMDLDWSFTGKPVSKVVILLHGLEGNAQRAYMAGSARLFNEEGYDACSVNFRGCSGEPNRLFRSYHSGATEDLEAVVQHIIRKKSYTQLYLNGFSLGGNMCLKYLGEGRKLPPQIKGAIAISVPCDLHSSLLKLLSAENVLYARRFKKYLMGKLRIKQAMFPEFIKQEEVNNIRTLKDFDDIYTSRAHGFDDALDYYKKCSCRQFLRSINVPTLLINARNDSFLGAECYPVDEARNNPYLFLEIPDYGGHVGFFGWNNQYYTEKRAIKFLNEGV